MKLKTKIIAGAAGLAFLTFAAGNLQAQVTNVISITSTAQVQGGTNDNGKVTTVATPTKHAIDTKQMLVFLAEDENAAGNYSFASFPAGAQLVLISSNNTADFQVLDKHNNFLVDVSDILSDTHGTNDVKSGKVSDTTGLYDPSGTDLRVLIFGYDDSGISRGVGLRFDLVGLETITATDSTPKAGVYTETVSVNVTASAGDGIYQGAPFVITGSLSFQGKVTLTE